WRLTAGRAPIPTKSPWKSLRASCLLRFRDTKVRLRKQLLKRRSANRPFFIRYAEAFRSRGTKRLRQRFSSRKLLFQLPARLFRAKVGVLRDGRDPVIIDGSSRPSDAARCPDSPGLAAQTGRERLEIHETRYSPRLSSRNRPLCLRQQFSNTFHGQRGQAQRRNLLQLPPILHR